MIRMGEKGEKLRMNADGAEKKNGKKNNSI